MMEVVARYVGVADVAWKMGRIMLKYRPIAPKPITGGAVTVGSIDLKSNGVRGKRERGSLKEAGRRGRKRGKKEVAGVFLEDEVKKINDYDNNLLLSTEAVVTLRLMPETPERKEESPVGIPSAVGGHVAVNYGDKTSVYQPYNASGTQYNKNDFLESSTNSYDDSSNSSGGVNIVTPRPARPVASWVTVESVTDMWHDGEIPLPVSEHDTCPSFVSDSCDRVTWVNEAYKRMVVGSGGGEEEEVRVALVTRGAVPRDFDTCFTCRARVNHVCRERGKVSMVVPCDVWRLGGGRFAWRLDVKAALSLSLGCEM